MTDQIHVAAQGSLDIALNEVRDLYQAEFDKLGQMQKDRADPLSCNWQGGRVNGLGDVRMILQRLAQPPAALVARDPQLAALRPDLAPAAPCNAAGNRYPSDEEASWAINKAHEFAEGLRSKAETGETETFVINNPDGSVSLDAYAGKSREELKERCRELISALTDWQFAAAAAAISGGNKIANVPEPHQSRIAKFIEAYSDDDMPPLERSSAETGEAP